MMPILRVVHIGQTAIGSRCATGQLLSNLLCKQPKISLVADISRLQDGDINCTRISLESFFDSETNTFSESKLILALKPLQPDLLLIRLDSYCSNLNVSKIREALKCKVVISIMDFIGKLDTIKYSLSVADKIWFISDSLMREYAEYLFAAKVFVLSNGVAHDWGRYDSYLWSERRILKIGFFGNLNANQSLEAVIALSKALAQTNSKQIKYYLNIYSRNAGIGSVRAMFSNYAHFVRLHPFVPASQYRSTVQNQDLLYFGYGTSPVVIEYIGNSISNKLPEVLCSGIPSIGFGSNLCESIKIFKLHRPDFFVDGTNASSDRCLLGLLEDIHNDYGKPALAARRQATTLLDRFSLEKMRDIFAQELLEMQELS